jgi:hypothetical protein
MRPSDVVNVNAVAVAVTLSKHHHRQTYANEINNKDNFASAVFITLWSMNHRHVQRRKNQLRGLYLLARMVLPPYECR